MNVAPIGIDPALESFTEQVTNTIKKAFTADEVELFKQHDLMLAGGALLSIKDRSQIHDFDLYPLSDDHHFSFINLKKSFDKVFKKANEASITCNAITYTTPKHNELVQLINSRFSGYTHEETLQNFDIMNCQVGYSFRTGKVIFGSREARELFFKRFRQLKFNRDGIKHAHGDLITITTLKRAFKYVERGYPLCNKDMIYMFNRLLVTKKTTENVFNLFFGLGMSEDVAHMYDKHIFEENPELRDAYMLEKNKLEKTAKMKATIAEGKRKLGIKVNKESNRVKDTESFWDSI